MAEADMVGGGIELNAGGGTALEDDEAGLPPSAAAAAIACGASVGNGGAGDRSLLLWLPALPGRRTDLS